MSAALVSAVVLAGARLTVGIEEVGGPNAGRGVELIQAATGNRRGDPWCASWVARVGAIMCDAVGVKWPLPLTASCDVLLEFGRSRQVTYQGAAVGDVFLVMASANDAVHTGFVSRVEPGGVIFGTREGNTNPGGGREGYGVFARTRGGADDPLRYLFLRWVNLL